MISRWNFTKRNFFFFKNKFYFQIFLPSFYKIQNKFNKLISLAQKSRPSWISNFRLHAWKNILRISLIRFPSLWKAWRRRFELPNLSSFSTNQRARLIRAFRSGRKERETLRRGDPRWRRVEERGREKESVEENLRFSTAEVGAAGSAELPVLTSGLENRRLWENDLAHNKLRPLLWNLITNGIILDT